MSRSAEKAGAPRWTYVAAAIVGLATLAWAVASHFLPSPPAAREESKAAGPVVQVSGSHNVGVGVMSGGTINQGADPAPQGRAADAGGAGPP
jgi:hypothetical protein